MKQSTALAILDSGASIFLTGPAGSGKTYVLNSFISDARSAGKSVAVTASTGIAATHLGGTTIHAWSGIGIADSLNDRMLRDMSKSRQDRIAKADVLVIDEVSMLHDYRLDMIDRVCRHVRADESPFGGLQVVLSGDFFQLPPVNRDDAAISGGFVTGSNAWQDLDPVVCYLEEQYRQDDDLLLEILTALRSNDLRRRHAEALMDRKVDVNLFDDPATELYTRNIDVDSVNLAKLMAMEGEVHEYEMRHTGRASAYESLRKSCLAPEVLQLKEGAYVMFVKNAQDRSYANGTLGIVKEFDADTDYPVVETRDGRLIDVEPDTWEMRDGDKKIASITQLPLRLAWAITIHKSQGMTLDAAHIDLSTAFVPGMGYVALSRVRSLDTLTLAGINRMALTMHDQAHDLDDMLRRRSSQDNSRFADLEKSYLVRKEKKRLKDQSKKGKASNLPMDDAAKAERSRKWHEKIDKMRETYPNAFRPWVDEEDSRLQKLWSGGEKVDALTTIFGRHPGSIQARLKKHFGEDLF